MQVARSNKINEWIDTFYLLWSFMQVCTKGTTTEMELHGKLVNIVKSPSFKQLWENGLFDPLYINLTEKIEFFKNILAQAACVRHACLREPCVAWPLLLPSFWFINYVIL